jgi:hypothetical protein
MRQQFVASVVDRVRANADAVRAAPEAFIIVAIAALAIPCIAIPRHFGGRFATLQSNLAVQAALAADYRAQLREAAPEEAAARIGRLTALTASLQKRLYDADEKIAALQRGRRDARRLYADDSPIATVEDPKVDAAHGRVTFPLVTSGSLLSVDRPYEYRDWKLACGGSQSYSVVDDTAAPEFSYSHLICRIVGVR